MAVLFIQLLVATLLWQYSSYSYCCSSTISGSTLHTAAVVAINRCGSTLYTAAIVAAIVVVAVVVALAVVMCNYCMGVSLQEQHLHLIPQSSIAC